MRVESLEKWAEVSTRLSEKGYRLYMMQYGIDHPEGFHAWFLQHETPGVEIVTYSKDVRDAIYKFQGTGWSSGS